MSLWIFAQGKQAETALGDIVAAGAFSIALAGADAIFSPGQALFISEADGSEVDALGHVVSATPSLVRFSLPLRASKTSGAKLWRAASALALGAESVSPVRRRAIPGVAVERSLGGEFYAIQTAEPADELELELESMTPQTEAALDAWLRATALGGLEPFTLVSPGRRIEAARLSGEPRLRLARAGDRSSLRISILIEAQGEYR